MPKPRRSGGSPSIRTPSSRISPRVGGMSPASRLSAVDLPHPEGPRTVTNSRPRTSRVRSSRTTFAPKRLVRRNARLVIKLEFLDPLRAHLPVPPVHRGDQVLHGELGDDPVLLLHVGVLGPPVLAHERLDVGRRPVERRRLDGGTDERLPREHLLLRPPHELHEVEDDLLLGCRHALRDRPVVADPEGDRKSTRLNSSHSQISYAVFCLKKKKKESNI